MIIDEELKGIVAKEPEKINRGRPYKELLATARIMHPKEYLRYSGFSWYSLKQKDEHGTSDEI